MKYIIDIKGEIEGDYEIIGKYEEKSMGEWKKGKWIHGQEVCREYIGITLIKVLYDHWRCSVCGYRIENEPIWSFCPNCGADMRGKNNDIM